jgi:hypothetical protein
MWKKVKKVWKCNLIYCNPRCNVSHSPTTPSKIRLVLPAHTRFLTNLAACLAHTSTNHYWCPMVVTSILKTCSSSTAYYLSRGVVQKSRGTRAARILSAKSKVIPANSTDLNITTATVVAARSQCPPNVLWLSYEMGAFRSSRIMGKGCAPVRFVSWSGGLWNPGNALPRCQLQNLSRLPRNIRTSIEAAKPSRGHQNFLPGVVDWMMSPLEYLP